MRAKSNRSLSRLSLATMPLLGLLPIGQAVALGQSWLRTQNFSSDPGWDGHNNRAQSPGPVQITQNFGFSNTSNAGGPAGEIGGFVTPAGEPAWYAKTIPVRTFNDTLSVTGVLNVPVNGGGHTLIGFFNSNYTNEWRTPNSVNLRIYGRGSYFYAYADYATSLWRAGGNALVRGGSIFELPAGDIDYNFSLQYNPNGNNGGGSVVASIWNASVGTYTAVTNLEPGHKADAAAFNRFGILNVMKSADGGGEIWLDNLNINNAGTETFNSNPLVTWSGLNNRSAYLTYNVRPRFDFGYSPGTNFAGGNAPGEIGGQIFRGDSRVQFAGTRMAYYGDRLQQTLDLNKPLRASGKVAFRRGVSDSTTLIGFFHSTGSIRDSDAQASAVPENFAGASIEGPSREGFFFYPTYGTDAEATSATRVAPPYIYPDGTSHDFSIEYYPLANGTGRLIVTLDGQPNVLTVSAAHRQIGAQFDRFGLITTHIDGNGQTVYFDDLTYSVATGPAQWLTDSGDYHHPANWSAAVPNGVGAEANFLGVIVDARTVYTDTPVTLGTLRFDNANSYVLGGSGRLTMQAAGGSAALVQVLKGTHKINLPLTIASNTTLEVASGATLKLSDPVTVLAGKTLSESGSGGSVVYESMLRIQDGASVTLRSQRTAIAALSLAEQARL
ncbi:MAG TPA: hypothetical protein VNL70_10680, partial [Tepidisphaeraceae bacterium]|nr:hypothetical protein [Tepidisphaeraceae bacterium]